METHQAVSELGATGIDAHLILILGIMLITGILGGLANYFLTEKEVTHPLRTGLRYGLLGVVAALTVPLFLNMISSHMLESTRLRPLDLFVFAGFCLLYVVVSRRFFENLAARLQRQVELVRQDLHRLQTDRPLSATKTEEDDTPQEPHALSSVEQPRNSVSYGDIEILRAIRDGNMVYGAVSGLAAKAAMPKEQVGPRLTALRGMGLIESRIDDKNVVRWYISQKGKMLLDNMFATNKEELREAS